MENKKEMTIPNVSAATDAEQSLSKCTDNSIVNQDTDFKGYEQSFEEMQCLLFIIHANKNRKIYSI